MLFWDRRAVRRNALIAPHGLDPPACGWLTYSMTSVARSRVAVGTSMPHRVRFPLPLPPKLRDLAPWTWREGEGGGEEGLGGPKADRVKGGGHHPMGCSL